MEDETTTETTSLMNKKADELTVGEAIKLNLGVVAVFAAVPLAVAGGAAAYDKFTDWRIRRKIEKELENQETPELETEV